MTKRKITRKIKAHKGGRTEKKEARLTPDEKQRLNKVLANRNQSFSDFVMSMVTMSEDNE